MEMELHKGMQKEQQNATHGAYSGRAAASVDLDAYYISSREPPLRPLTSKKHMRRSKRKGITTNKRSNLLHFIKGTAPATTYLEKTHACEQKKGQDNQQREQNLKSFPGEVAHKWARWLHHPCRLGDPHRFKAGGKIRSGP